MLSFRARYRGATNSTMPRTFDFFVAPIETLTVSAI